MTKYRNSILVAIPLGVFLWLLNFFLDDLYHWITGDYLPVLQQSLSYRLLLQISFGLFSLVLVLAASLIMVLRESHRPTSTAAVITDDAESLECSSPTPTEIQDAIYAQPPLLRAQFAKNYLGIKVNWTGTFDNVYDEGNGIVTVGVASHVYLFYFSTSLEEYPIFRTLQPESVRIRVSGTISSIDGPIYLKDTHFVIVQPPKQ